MLAKNRVIKKTQKVPVFLKIQDNKIDDVQLCDDVLIIGFFSKRNKKEECMPLDLADLEYFLSQVVKPSYLCKLDLLRLEKLSSKLITHLSQKIPLACSGFGHCNLNLAKLIIDDCVLDFLTN